MADSESKDDRRRTGRKNIKQTAEDKKQKSGLFEYAGSSRHSIPQSSIVNRKSSIENPQPPAPGTRLSGYALSAVKALIFIFFSAAACATVLALFSRYYWIFDNMTAFRLQYYAILTTGAIIYFARKKYLIAALFLAVSFANVPAFARLYIGGYEPIPDSRTIRIISFNVKEQNADRSRAVEYFGESKADIIVVVEVHTPWIVDLEALAGEYPYRAGIVHTGTVVFSKIPIVDKKADWVGTRAIVTVTLKAEGKMLRLVTAHPTSPVRRKYHSRRGRLLDETARIASEAGKEGEVILIGDLNLTPFSPYFGDFVAASGLRDARRGFGFRPTWPTFMPLLYVPIDHCLVSDGIAVHTFTTGPRLGSDHLPIIVDITIRRDAPAK